MQFGSATGRYTEVLTVLSRRQLVQAALIAGSGMWSGCSPPGPVKIGFLGGMSGRSADLGIGGRNGTQLAVEHFNARGGLDGRSVELMVEDDEQDEAVARRRLTQLFDAGVVAVVGPTTSAMAVAMVPLANERGIPLVSPTATTHELTGKEDMFFRLVPDAATGARQQAAYVHALGARRLVTVADLKNRAFSQSWAQTAAERFIELGGALAKAINFEAAPGLRFADLAQQVVDAQLDAVVIAASATDSALLVQQIRQRDSQARIALSPWAGTETLPEMGGRAVEGAIVAQYFDRTSQAQAYRAFVAQYHGRFGEAPGFPAVNAYDATGLVLATLGRNSKSSALAAALAATRQHAGLQRDVALDAYGDSQAPMFLTVLKGGAYVLLA